MGSFEPDTGLVVNTMRGTVHRPGCDVVTRTNARSGPWLAPWKGVAMKDDDKPCGYCKPDLDAARAAAAPSDVKPAIFEAGAVDPAYEAGYSDGESSVMADFAIALDEVWPEDKDEDPMPSTVAAYIAELQQQITTLENQYEEMVNQ